jgi:hypothetical protein
VEADSIKGATGGATGAEVVAIGAGAASVAPEEVSLLGYLFWYSVSEAEVRREDLIGAMVDAGLDERFGPGEISTRDAFRRSTASLQRSRVPLDARSQSRLFGTERRHANLLVRDVRTSGTCVVRQLVREVVDAVGATLEHRAVGQFELSAGGEMRAFPLAAGLLAEEEEILGTALFGFERARAHHDAGAVRRTIGRALASCSPVGLRASGGVYFVPRSYEPELRAIERFVGEFKDRLNEKAKRTLVMAVELVDREEYRDAIAASLDEQVDREANALIREMGEILRKRSKITRRRQEDLFERVRALKGSVAEYEALLEREIADAWANLELAQEEAVSLLSRVEVG